MVNISSPFTPSPLREGRRHTATVRSVEVVRKIKTAFIPYGTNAVRIRGATHFRLAFDKNPVGDATGASLTLFKHDHLVYALAL